MIDLYQRNVWHDGKTVNVIAEACLTARPKLVATAVHFFLGTNDAKKDDEDDEDAPDLEILRHRLQINKKKGSKSNALEKAKAMIKKKESKKSRSEVFNFSALHLLNDPQNFAEKLLSRLKNATSNTLFRFELRLEMMNLISRLIGIHKLIVIPFYDFVIPYLKPQQRDVTAILAYMAQASHELVPPDVMGPVVQTIADNFVWSNAASEVVTAGLNGLREVCARCPLAMSESLLQSLIEDYKNNKDKSAMMAGRSLLGLFREVNPEMLRKKDRGKAATLALMEKKKVEGGAAVGGARYGEVKVMEMIEGADLLMRVENGELGSDGEELEDEDEEFDEEDGTPKKKRRVEESPGDGWEGWEIASMDGEDVSDDDEEGAGKKKSKKNNNKKGKKAEKVEVLEVEGEEEEEGDDEGWEDEDGEGEEGDEGPGDGWEGWEEASLDSEDDEDGDDEDDGEAPELVSDDEDEDDDTGSKSSIPGKMMVGPKQAKLHAQQARREQVKGTVQSEELKQKLIQAATEKVCAGCQSVSFPFF
jgi:protein SDA1